MNDRIKNKIDELIELIRKYSADDAVYFSLNVNSQEANYGFKLKQFPNNSNNKSMKNLRGEFIK